MRTINRILLTVPNTGWFGKRRWIAPPLTLGLLAAIVPDRYETSVLDPNRDDLGFDETVALIAASNPDVAAVTCLSLEYAPSLHKLTAAIRAAAPQTVIIVGGVYATTSPELAMRDGTVDFAVLGEGERRFPRLLKVLNGEENDLAALDGLAYRKNGNLIINPIVNFIKNLDEVPFPAYAKVGFADYFSTNNQYAVVANARYQPYAFIMTSRGCPYKCIYCSTHAIDGRKVRWRSAENVLAEIDRLVGEFGVREINFLDDNLVLNRPRFVNILNGLIERDYDLHWKSLNLAVFLLDDQLLELMRESKCYQLILAIESGSQRVLDDVLKKPLKIDKAPAVVAKAKELGFETAADFIIGSPGETWDEIRETFRFADELDVDMVLFHISTPLPSTELYNIARTEGLLPAGFDFGDAVFFGFGRGVINTDEFRAEELHMLRALEWDRINFKTPEKRERFARMAGVTQEELKKWRRNTIRNLGVYFPNAEGSQNEAPVNNGLLDKNGGFAKILNG